MKTLKKVLLALVGILLVPILVLATFSRNDIVKERSDGGYDVVEDVTYTRTDEGKNACASAVSLYKSLRGTNRLCFISIIMMSEFLSGKSVCTH